jgi:hypothetical protein
MKMNKKEREIIKVIATAYLLEGVQQDCMACPVALAVRRVVKDKVRIEVRDLSVLIEIPEQLLHMEKGVVMDNDIHEVEDDLFMHRTALPAKARAFIDAYDTAEPINELPVSVMSKTTVIKPFTFTLSIPKVAHRV